MVFDQVKLQGLICEGVSQFAKLLPTFATSAPNIGVEFETHLVHDRIEAFHPAPYADTVIAQDSRFRPEIGKSQVEYSLGPERLCESTLLSWNDSSIAALRRIDEILQPLGARALQLSLPLQFTEQDISASSLFPSRRFDYGEQEWKERLERRRMRGEVRPQIGDYQPSDLGFAGCRSSLQLHLQLPNDKRLAAKIWNAAHFVTPHVLATFTASPLFLGKPTGEKEVRISLWEDLEDFDRGRVFYGPGWISSAIEVLDYYVTLPFLYLGERVTETNPLYWLRSHVKNLWPHLRLIPEVMAEGAHWRIENRVFPALGPKESIQLAAMYYGALFGAMYSDYSIEERICFKQVQQGFRQAARYGLSGLGASLYGGLGTFQELVDAEILPLVRSGLRYLGFAEPTITFLIDPIQRRARRGTTPADKILQAYEEDELSFFTRSLLKRQV